MSSRSFLTWPVFKLFPFPVPSKYVVRVDNSGLLPKSELAFFSSSFRSSGTRHSEIHFGVFFVQFIHCLSSPAEHMFFIALLQKYSVSAGLKVQTEPPWRLFCRQIPIGWAGYCIGSVLVFLVVLVSWQASPAAACILHCMLHS